MTGWMAILTLLAPMQAEWSAIALEFEGAAGSILADDLDGDGLGDVLLRAGRRASVFFLGRDGAGAASDVTCDLPDDTVFVDLGDVEHDGARELCLLTPTGVKAIAFAGRCAGAAKPIPGLTRDDLILTPVPAVDVMWNDVFLDLDGRGPEDVLLPGRSGYHVLLRAETGNSFAAAGVVPIAPLGSLALSAGSDLGEWVQTLELPRVFTGDLDGDRSPEVVTFDGRSARAWSRPPDAGDKPWVLRAERTLYHGEPTIEEEYLSARQVLLADLDGAGRSTLVVVRAAQSELDFIDAARDGLLADRRTLRLDGWIRPPEILDLDGDGRLDLVAPTMEPLGMLRLAKIFVTRSFELRFWIFRNQEGVRFARTPDEVRDLEIPLRYETGAQGARVEYQTVYSFAGDFNGDGAKDFLVKGSDTRLDVYPGTGKGSFAPQPAHAIKIDDTAPYLSIDARVFDLNRDGRSDVLLHYDGGDSLPHKYLLLLSGAP